MDETNEKEPPPLKIDPQCLQDALRVFLMPIKNNDARLDFYAVYKKEATEYDADYVKKYEEDLNTTLIFAGLFSAVSSAFVLDVQSKLEPDPNDQSAALLRAILLTLNQSAIPGESPTIPPTHEDPPGEIITASALMYASLLISLLAAFIAMLGKQWLNRYLRNTGGSTIERCGDRQRKLEGLEKWPFHTFVESLPVMLQIALLLLACGLCRHMASINSSVAAVLFTFTALGFFFYFGIVIAGTSSYECPFQTPASATLRSLWKKVQPRVTSVVLPIAGIIRQLRETILCQTLRTALHLPRLAALRTLWKEVQSTVLRPAFRLPLALGSILRNRPPLPTVQNGFPVPQQNSQWLASKDLTTFLRINASDVRCVSWILKNITDPEALDAAVRLAGTIRWFEDQTNVEPPYDIIVSAFEECFDSTKKVYPGLKDRAYYSMRAILWIHALAQCRSQEVTQRFPLPIIGEACEAPPGQDDLTHLLSVCLSSSGSKYRSYIHFSTLYTIPQEADYVHAQWTSNLLLHLAWTKQGDPGTFSGFREFKKTGYRYNDWDSIPLDTTLNRFLIWCIFLGSPVEGEVLRIQDKSDRLGRISAQLHQAIIAAIAIPITHRHDHSLLPDILHSLTTWKSRPRFFTEMAYEWCSVICEQHPDLDGKDRRGRELLFLSLEIGFRHLDSWDVNMELTHTEHHRRMIDVVFRRGGDGVVADFLCAWASGRNRGPAYLSLRTCASYFDNLLRLEVFSPRLRNLLITSVLFIGYSGFEQFGGEKLFQVLDLLHIRVEDTSSCRDGWVYFFLNLIRSAGDMRRLSYPYWELLMELAISNQWTDQGYSQYSFVMESLEDFEEWDRLECWIGVVWTLWDPDSSCRWRATNLESGTLSLLRRQPNSLQKLQQQMKRLGGWKVESFQRLCGQLTPLASGEPGESGRSSSLGIPLSFLGGDTF